MATLHQRLRGAMVLPAVAGGLLVLAANLTNDFSAEGSGAAVDELGYLGNARHLSGGEDVLAWGRSPYRLAYSIVISPIVGLTEDPVAAYQRVVDFNVVLLVVLFLLLAHLVRRLWPSCPATTCAAVALAGTCYPPIVFYANTAFSETFLSVVFALWVVAVHRTASDSAASWYLLGLSAYLGYFAHGRFAFVLPVTAFFVGWSIFRARRSVPLWSAAGALTMLVLTRLFEAPNTSRNSSSQARQMLDTAVDHPSALLSTILGQSWTVVAGTAAIPLLALASFVVSPSLRRRLSEDGRCWLAWVTMSASVLLVSALFMARVVVTRDEFTFMVYERYVAAVLPVVLVLSLLVLVWARAADVRYERVVSLGAAFALLIVVPLSYARAEYFGRPPFLLNTPTLSFFQRHDLLELWPTVIAAFVVGAVGVSIIWWRANLGLLFMVVFALAVGRDISGHALADYYEERTRQTHIVDVVDALGDEFEGPIVYDTRIGSTFSTYHYDWLRPTWGIVPLDASTDVPSTALVLSRPELMADVSGARLVTFENIAAGFGGEGLGLWAVGGSIEESLERRSWLAPQGYVGVVTPQYDAALDLEISRVDGSEAVLGGSVSLSVEATGTAPVFNTRQLAGGTGAMNIGTKLFDGDGELIIEGRVELPVGLLPGQTQRIDVPVGLAGAAIGPFRLDVTPVLEGHRWLTDETISVAVGAKAP